MNGETTVHGLHRKRSEASRANKLFFLLSLLGLSQFGLYILTKSYPMVSNPPHPLRVKTIRIETIKLRGYCTPTKY